MSDVKGHPWVDVVASALTDDLLLPYVPPARPLSMGGRASLWIRQGYLSRDHAPSGSDDAHVAGASGVASIVQPLASRLIGGKVWDISALSFHELLGQTTQQAEQLVACMHRLEREPDVEALLAALRDLRSSRPLLLITSRVRASTVDGDDAGPPMDPRHLRQWTFFELHALLNDAGLAPHFGGVLRDDRDTVGHADVTRERDAVFVIVGAPSQRTTGS